MLNGLLDSSSAAGVECILHPDGKSVFNLFVLKKERSKLKTESSYTGIDFETIKKVVSTKVPVSLVINGKGIIHKKINVSGKEDFSSLLHKIFPNANPSEFYVQHTSPDRSSIAFVSIIRKNIVDDIIARFSNSGFYIVSCSMGPFTITSVLPLLDNPTGGELIIANHKLNLHEGGIENYQQLDSIVETNPISIGGESVKQELALSFALAISYFSGFSLDHNISSVRSHKEEFRQKTIFHFAAWAALVFFFVSLLINYFLFDHYSHKKKEYSSQVSFSKDMLQRYDTLKKQIDQRQKFLEQAGLLEASRSSFYADRLAADIPVAIQLSQMQLFPLIKSSNESNNKMDFLQKDIRISGSCKRSTELNEWMNSIKRKDWVREVAILNYTQDKSQDEGEFSIEIKIK